VGISRLLGVAVLVCLIAACATGSPISYLSATTVPTSFTPTGGDFGLGLLTLHGIRPLIIHYGETKVVLEGTEFYLTASLRENGSAGGQVKGSFEGGTFRLSDPSGGDLLVGEIQTLMMSEFFDGLGIISVAGSFHVLSGELLADFSRQGTIFELMFDVEPRSVADFSQEFSGFSDISLAPVIAEPITVTALGIGLVGLCGRRRRA